MSEENKEVLKPFEKDYTMTQPFGVFFWINKRKLKHQGVDWATPIGTPMLACFDGRVVRVEKFRLNGYGRSIYLRSENGKYEVLYAHLENIFVEVGSNVKTGDILGHSGNTGFSTGPHLHFGLKLYNEYVDPLKYVDIRLPAEMLIKPDEYVVKNGDSLSEIAAKFYVGADLWPLLYDENVDIIGSDPNLIKPGQVLKIPKPNRKTKEVLKR